MTEYCVLGCIISAVQLLSLINRLQSFELDFRCLIELLIFFLCLLQLHHIRIASDISGRPRLGRIVRHLSLCDAAQCTLVCNDPETAGVTVCFAKIHSRVFNSAPLSNGHATKLDGTRCRGVSIFDNTRPSSCRYATQAGAESRCRADAAQREAAVPEMYQMFRFGVQPSQAPCKSDWADRVRVRSEPASAYCLVRAGPAGGWHGARPGQSGGRPARPY